jgi:hypothetical protein
MTKTKRQFDLMEFMGNACMITLALGLIYGLVAYAFLHNRRCVKRETKEDRRLLCSM